MTTDKPKLTHDEAMKTLLSAAKDHMASLDDPDAQAELAEAIAAVEAGNKQQPAK